MLCLKGDEKVRNRTKAASVNAATMLITQIIGLLLRFILQTVFIRELSADFLGLNGLFSNIISFLNFADLGIGSAITVALYKPVAENDTQKLRSLMRLYQRVYQIIIIVFILVGLVFSPFVYLLIKDPHYTSWNIMMWFDVYLISTVATYFSAHKRSFIMATQDGYINSLNDFVFRVMQQILQIIILLTIRSYTLYLLVQLACAWLSNIALSKTASRRYPLIFNHNKDVDRLTISEADGGGIKKNIFGAISSRIGTIIVFGTDNIILSTFVGLISVAQYANYMLIIQGIDGIFSKVVNSVVGSIGNLHATAESKRQETVLNRMLYLNAMINMFVTIGFSICLMPFINIWVGKKFVLGSLITLVIVLNYSINQSRYIYQSFISGMGLYWPLRWKSLIESLINLVASLFLVVYLKLGIFGVVGGTLISNCVINTWWEPLIVYKYGLHLSMWKNMLKSFVYELLAIIGAIGSILISNQLIGVGIVELIFIAMVIELFGMTLFVALSYRIGEFDYFLSYLKKRFK